MDVHASHGRVQRAGLFVREQRVASKLVIVEFFSLLVLVLPLCPNALRLLGVDGCHQICRDAFLDFVFVHPPTLSWIVCIHDGVAITSLAVLSRLSWMAHEVD